MKILLVAINAKYIHSNLAVYCLKTYAEKNMPQDVNVQIELAEYTINQNRDEILKDIYRRQADDASAFHAISGIWIMWSR